ncbi:MAG: hypothetical protein GX366_05420 [Epulopiscium sp.]|nr:hypothetical protein [Candidatus Epulonipiscium sp.]
MFYSILPIDDKQNQQIEYQEVIYKNQLLLTRTINGTQTIERLYSTNPEDFLNPDFQPGTILENPLINSQKRCYNKY